MPVGLLFYWKVLVVTTTKYAVQVVFKTSHSGRAMVGRSSQLFENVRRSLPVSEVQFQTVYTQNRYFSLRIFVLIIMYDIYMDNVYWCIMIWYSGKSSSCE